MGGRLTCTGRLCTPNLGEEIDFGLPGGNFDPVENLLEFGVAISFRDRPYDFWIFKIDRFGLGYQFSSNDRFKAITISLRSWFTK